LKIAICRAIYDCDLVPFKNTQISFFCVILGTKRKAQSRRLNLIALKKRDSTMI
jgi:hypothetical protein